VKAKAEAVLDHAARTSVASLPSRSEQPVTGVSAGFFPCGRLLVLTGQPAGGERRSKQPTGSATLYPSRLTTPAFTVLEASGLWAGGAGRLARPQAAAPAFATVGEWVFVGYASFGSAAESQVIGVASSGPRAEELAERYVEEDRFAWRRPTWLEWDSARRVCPRSMCAVIPSRYVGCRWASMSFPAARWSPNRSPRGTSVPHAGRCQTEVRDRGHGRMGGA
jgi:hypothetical protein